jgi:hypothetical protein
MEPGGPRTNGALPPIGTPPPADANRRSDRRDDDRPAPEAAPLGFANPQANPQVRAIPAPPTGATPTGRHRREAEQPDLDVMRPGSCSATRGTARARRTARAPRTAMQLPDQRARSSALPSPNPRTVETLGTSRDNDAVELPTIRGEANVANAIAGSATARTQMRQRQRQERGPRDWRNASRLSRSDHLGQPSSVELGGSCPIAVSKVGVGASAGSECAGCAGCVPDFAGLVPTRRIPAGRARSP